jgi:hypothetical protein
VDVVLTIGGLVAIAGDAVWRARRRHARQRRLMHLADRAGLRFAAVDPDGDTAWLPFRWALEGTWLAAENLVSYRDDDVLAFDLVLEEPVSASEGRPRRSWHSCAAVPIEAACPPMLIRPQQPVDGLAEAFTGPALDLDLEAFNRRFTVRCDDRRFAVACCDQRMIRAILTLPPGVAVATNEDRLLLLADELPPPQVVLLLEAARRVRDAVPPVLTSLYPPRPARSPFEERWLQGRWSPDPIGRE